VSPAPLPAAGGGPLRRTARIAATAGIAAVGVALFIALGLPLPWLLGPMSLSLIAALLRVPLEAPPGVPLAMRTVLGVAVGAAITPELIGRLPGMGISVALVPLFIVACGAVGVPYFRRVCGFDRATAFFSAMPGGFQDMVLLGLGAGGNPRALSLVHATRVLAIVAVMPALVGGLWGRSLDGPAGAPASAVPLHELLVMAACAGLGWWIAERLRLFGAAILGPMVAAIAASLLGLIHQRPPAEAILAAQFFIGIGIGALYRGVTLGELRTTVLAALGYCVILTAISAGFAEIVVQLGLAEPVEAFLSFAPCGQGEMVVIAIVSGADVAFVVTHHLVRLTTVILGAPFLARHARND
jgi:membrane AbrB-like protein